MGQWVQTPLPRGLTQLKPHVGEDREHARVGVSSDLVLGPTTECQPHSAVGLTKPQLADCIAEQGSRVSYHAKQAPSWHKVLNGSWNLYRSHLVMV